MILLLALECILKLILLYYLIQVYLSNKSRSCLAFIFAFLFLAIRNIFQFYSLFPSKEWNSLPLSLDEFLGVITSFLFLLGVMSLKQTLINWKENLVESQHTLKDYKTSIIDWNEQYVTAIESAGVGVWDWDILNNTYHWNEQMFVLWDLEKNESMDINRKRLIEKLFPEDNENSQKQLKLALEGKKDYKAELRFNLKDGTTRYTHAIGKIFRDKSGLPTRMIGVNVDITEIKHKEEELQKSEQKWRSLVEAIPDYISIYDLDGKYIFLNHYAEGFSAKDIEGKYLFEFLSGESKSKMEDAFKKAVKTNQIQFIEHTGLGDNRSIRSYNNFIVPMSNNDKIENVMVITRDITEKKQAEKELQESLEIFNAALSSMTDAVFISDEKGNFTHFNEAFATFHRFKNMEECAKTLSEYPIFLEVYEANGELTPLNNWAVPRALRGESATNVEHILKRLDTGETWIGNYSLAPIRNINGMIIGSVVTARDITELKNIQKSILENERLLQMAYETTDMGIIKRDLNQGDMLIFNERAQAHCGVKMKEVPTMDVLKKIHPDDLVRLKQKMEKARRFENDGKYAMEYRILHDDGEYHWVAIEAQYIFEGEGVKRHPTLTISITRDITSRKNLEQEILEKNRLLEMAYEATEMGVWKHDISSNVFFFNERSQMHHGFSKAEIQFEELTSILHPDDIVELQNAFIRAIGLEGNGKYSQQFRIFHKDKGLRWLSIDAFISTDGEGENKHPIFAVGTSRDITNQKNVELELEKYHNQLENLVEERTKQLSDSLEQIQTINANLIQKEVEISSVNKELEAFSYSVSHDLRTPLRSIDGFSNLILKKYFELLPEEGQDYFQRIRNASQKMSLLIDDLLKLSKINRKEIHKEELNLSEIAISITNDLITQEPDRKGDFIIQPDIIVFADKSLIRIALQNLLANAWKYTRYKKEVKIELGSFMQEQTQVCFIKDNGAGFNMKYSDKLFGAFQRLHNSSEFEGNGIGLATTQRILNRHGGRIWTEAEVSKGATFYFTL